MKVKVTLKIHTNVKVKLKLKNKKCNINIQHVKDPMCKNGSKESLPIASIHNLHSNKFQVSLSILAAIPRDHKKAWSIVEGSRYKFSRYSIEV